MSAQAGILSCFNMSRRKHKTPAFAGVTIEGGALGLGSFNFEKLFLLSDEYASTPITVMPAQAGILSCFNMSRRKHKTPAFAGVTIWGAQNSFRWGDFF